MVLLGETWTNRGRYIVILRWMLSGGELGICCIGQKIKRMITLIDESKFLKPSRILHYYCNRTQWLNSEHSPRPYQRT